MKAARPPRPEGQATGATVPARLAGAAREITLSLLGLGLLFVVAVNFLNAVARHVLGVAPVGMDELMVYVVIWVVMIGAILSLVGRSHINVNLLPLSLRGRGRHLLHVVHDLAALVACGFGTHASWQFIGRIHQLDMRSMGLGLPMAIPHGAVLVGLAGLTLAAAVLLLRDIAAFLRNDPTGEPTEEVGT